MSNVLVVYASDYGHTKRAAEAIAVGAERVEGTTVRSRPASEVSARDVADADGLILGSPVHMGSLHWEVKRLIDRTLSELWNGDVMVGRAGGVFTTGGGLGGASGGCEFAMPSMLAVIAELGMVLVPLPKSAVGFASCGHHWGPYARCGSSAHQQTPLPDHCLPLLEGRGANVARVASLAARCTARSVFGRASVDPIERSMP